jgi:hypothetical protein
VEKVPRAVADDFDHAAVRKKCSLHARSFSDIDGKRKALSGVTQVCPRQKRLFYRKLKVSHIYRAARSVRPDDRREDCDYGVDSGNLWSAGTAIVGPWIKIHTCRVRLA